MLEAINKNMRQYEELAFLMSDEQLGLFFSGLLATTNTNIKTVKPKKSTASIQQQVAKEGGLQIDKM